MFKQAAIFASLGAVVALFTAAIGQAIDETVRYNGFAAGVSFMSEYTPRGSWSWFLLSALAGAVIAAVIGVALRLAGIRITTDDSGGVGRVVVAGLLGTVVGLSPTLIYVGSAFAGLGMNESIAVSVELLLTMYAVSAVLAYVVAVAAVFGALRLSADTLTRQTTVTVASILPIGALLATAAGMGTAWMLDYRTSIATLVAVVLAVLVVLAATFAIARGRALRRVEGPAI